MAFRRVAAHGGRQHERSILFSMKVGLRFVAAFLATGITSTAQERRADGLLGNLAPIVRSIQEERGFPLRYAQPSTLSVEDWRRRRIWIIRTPLRSRRRIARSSCRTACRPGCSHEPHEFKPICRETRFDGWSGG
jgi:hypothetical protein